MTPKFKIGFELELNIPPTYTTGGTGGCLSKPEVPFWEGITNLPGLSKVIEGYDCHADYGMRAAEIRTPPQAIEEGIASFFALINYLAGFPGNDVYSTSRCGLHINVSEPDMMKSSITSLRFFNHIIQHYPEWAVMERFNRQINPTCHPWFTKETPIEARVASRHPFWSIPIGNRNPNYLSRSYEGYGLSVANKELMNPSSNRIEFRGHGNAGYHKKIDDLRFALDAIVQTCTTAFHAALLDTREESQLITHNW